MRVEEPGRIPPVPTGTARPEWSVMIPTYNCAAFLPSTLAGVLGQDPGPESMQIEVVDDCSADAPADVVRSLGRGRVEFWQQPRNVGVSANLTACVHRARGRYVHILHGDDLAYPGLYERVGAMFDADGDLDAVVVGAEEIDAEGRLVKGTIPLRPTRQVLDGFEGELFSWNPVRAPSVLARRSFYERIGGYHPSLRYCADWDMWKRMLVSGKVVYEPDVLVGYRVHSGSDTARLGHSVSQLREMIQSVRISNGYLPRHQARRWTGNVYYMIRRWAREERAKSIEAAAYADALRYSMTVVEATARLRLDRLISRNLRSAPA